LARFPLDTSEIVRKYLWTAVGNVILTDP